MPIPDAAVGRAGLVNADFAITDERSVSQLRKSALPDRRSACNGYPQRCFPSRGTSIFDLACAAACRGAYMAIPGWYRGETGPVTGIPSHRLQSGPAIA